MKTMPDREKVIRGLECCCTHIVGMSCGNCPYEIEQKEEPGIDECTTVLAYDALALLKEHEEQKQKWLQNIADNQLAFAPSERDNAYCYIKHQGIYDGLQMAYDILTEGR